MGWGHVLDFIGGLILLYFGWKGLGATAKASMRSPEGAVMWLFGFLFTGAAAVGGAMIAYNAGSQGYADQMYKEELREHIIKAHEIAVSDYLKAEEQFEKLSPQKQVRNAPALARMKHYAEKGVEEDLAIVDDYTAASLRKYGMGDVSVLEKEITISSMKTGVEQLIGQTKPH